MKFLSACNRGRTFLLRLKSADPASVTQLAYIAEAAFEYFVSITVSGAFLTLLIKQLKVSDALTGILSSITILACGMQMFAVTFIRRRRSIRASVLFLQTLQQLLFAGLFLLPFLPLGHGEKVALFVVLFLFSSFLSNLVAPAKYNWMMSFVEPRSRGAFTARKEMFSLVTGLLYNYAMSRVVDGCNAAGHPETGLRICAAVLLALTVLHAASLVVARDAPEVLREVRKTPSLAASYRSSFSNPGFVKILVVACGWNFADFVSTPYYNVYLLQELNCSVTFIAVAGIVCSAVRFFLSMPVGRYADRRGFAHSVELGLVLACAAFLLLVFWVPSNGKALYLLYQVPYAGSMAALSGGLLNIVFQYVPEKDRVGALGIYSALAGISGFLGSLAGGWVLNAVQAGGNRVFGLRLYGQQLLSALTLLMLAALSLYGRFVVERMQRLE